MNSQFKRNLETYGAKFTLATAIIVLLGKVISGIILIVLFTVSKSDSLLYIAGFANLSPFRIFLNLFYDLIISALFVIPGIVAPLTGSGYMFLRRISFVALIHIYLLSAVTYILYFFATVTLYQEISNNY